MNCSLKGYRCHFVECVQCYPPCQLKNITKYDSGVYEGCVAKETCSGVLIPKKLTEPCVGPCNEIKVPKAFVDKDGCPREVCEKAPCPIHPTPSPSPCEEITTGYDDCGCPFKKVRNQTSHECGDNECQRLTVVGEKCIIECGVTYSRECDDYCETREISGQVDNAMCIQPVTCRPKSCEEIGKNEGKCLFTKTDEKRFSDDLKCKCDSNQVDQFVKHTCSQCDEKTCRPNPCPKITMNCEDYQQSARVVCGGEFNKTCPEYCQKSLQCICETSDCLEGYDKVLVDCQMTDAQCKKDQKCCKKLCPNEDNGKKKQYACKLRCEVCPDMAGAMLTDDGVWKFGKDETCNADIRCCQGCKHASMVARCPSEWSEDKKKLCRCKA